MIYKVELPIYYTFERKTMKDKKLLIGINQMNILHYIPKNEIKQSVEQLIMNQLLVQEATGFKGKFETKMELYYKNVQSDPSNITMMSEKFALDAFQKADIIENDNVRFHVRSSFVVMGQDKTNPRVIFKLRPIEE